MDYDCMSLTQIGHKTLSQAKIQQYHYTKRLALQGTLYLNPFSDKGQSTFSRDKKKQNKIFPERSSYKQEQTWTLYSPF